jgi:endonuclease/exonuclease/phosphatase (EEP) superfamily protein YafD
VGVGAVATAVGVISALVLIPMAALALVRVLRLEDSRTVIVFETVTGYLLLPAYVVAIAAAIAGLKIICGCALLLAACHFVWFFPEFAGSRRVNASVATAARHVTLYSQNVMFNNPSPEGIGNQIKQTDADIVMLQELSERDFEAIRSTGAFDNYQYSFVRTTSGPRGLGIFSKYPLTEKQEVESPGFPQMRAVAHIDGEPLVLWNVHIRAPVDEGPAGWLGDMNQLNRRIHDEAKAVLIAGDFNATYGHRPYRNLLTDGFHEAAIDLGRGTARTWPVNTKWGRRLGGYVRFDHVLYNGKLRALSQREVDGNGSDHSGVITQLAML